MDALVLAYLAGVLDSDGYFTVRRSTYAMRVRGDAGAPIYSERVGCKQVQPEAIELLHEYFGGYRSIQKPSAKNGKPLHSWMVTDKQAAAVALALLPYLRLKRRQATLLLNLRASKNQPRTAIRTGMQRTRWGQEVTFKKKVVSDDVLAERERIFNAIRVFNDVRSHQPVLI